MSTQYLQDYIPLWAFSLVTAAIVGAALEIGFRIGRARRRRAPQEKDSPITATVSATLALLGFMLAITFGIAVSRFDLRQQFFIEEVDAIGTAYLRADILPPALRDDIKKLLRQYVDLRLLAVDTGSMKETISLSPKIHDELWKDVIAAEKLSEHQIGVGLLTESINDVIDLHTKRLFAAFRARIPPPVWMVLYLVAILGIGELGYHTAITGSARSPAAIGLIVAFAAVLQLIADLDRPTEGVLRVSQGLMRTLRASMTEITP